jgi:hypothetical protein
MIRWFHIHFLNNNNNNSSINYYITKVVSSGVTLFKYCIYISSLKFFHHYTIKIFLLLSENLTSSPTINTDKITRFLFVSTIFFFPLFQSIWMQIFQLPPIILKSCTSFILIQIKIRYFKTIVSFFDMNNFRC